MRVKKQKWKIEKVTKVLKKKLFIKMKQLISD